MARLNEPPAATATTTTANTAAAAAAAAAAAIPQPENIDALKRRFIRQNRELAKNNSNQSLRIRTLELDVSRLLAENLDLRNEVLHLHNELYTSQTPASTAAVQRVKQELLDKISELHGIVEGVEDTQKDTRWEEQGKKPLEGNWRERQPLSELMRDSQMPTIVEDKPYPRRTLDAEGMQAIRLSDHSSNESLELGPPPVARFEHEDPVKNASPLMNKTSPRGEDDDNALPSNFANLETRRKRKDAQPKLQIRRHSVLPQSPVEGEGEPTSTILRTGAKRKLADRESEKAVLPPSKGDFTFSRKTASQDLKSGEAEGKSRAAEQADIATSSPAKPARRVLADKSVNMSPRKPATTATKPEKPEKENGDKLPNPSRPTKDKETVPTRRRRNSSIPLPTPSDEAPAEILPTVEIHPDASATTSADAQPPPPKTPPEPSLFSPTPSEPSTLREARGDTPPPGDLSALSVTTDGGGRPSRRSRGQPVNYAEPSLMTKMRRPEKRMVDAVAGARRESSGVEPKRESVRRDSEIRVKKEPGLEDEEEEVKWRNLPMAEEVVVAAGGGGLVARGKGEGRDVGDSPLRAKSGGEAELALLPSNQTSQTNVAGNEKMPASTSSATISALMAAGRKRRHSVQLQEPQQRRSDSLESELERGTSKATATATRREGDVDDDKINATTKKLEDLNIYEFNASSPPLSSNSNSGSGGRNAAAKIPAGPTRSNSRRRHSSIPREFSSSSSLEVEGDGDASQGEGKEEVDGGRERRLGGDGAKSARGRPVGVGRRRSMML